MGSKLTDKISAATPTPAAVGKAAGKAGGAAGSALSAAKGARSSIAHKVSEASVHSVSRPNLDVKVRQAKIAGRAGRKLERARASAELSAERARRASELRLEKSRSRRAIRSESKAREHAQNAQIALERRLTKAERKLAKASRRRRRGLVFVVLAGGGAAAAFAARSRKSQPSAEEIFPTSPESTGTSERADIPTRSPQG